MFQTPKMIKERMQNFKAQTHTTQNNFVEKQTKKRLNKEFKKSHKDLRLVNDFIVYKNQLQDWEESANGNCLRARLNHLKSNPLNWLTESNEQKSENEAAIKAACKNVENKFLPFANGSCFDQLDEIFEQTLGCIKDLTTIITNTTETIQCVKDSITKGIDIITGQCQNPMFGEHAPTCKEYLEKELNVKDLEILKKEVNGNVQNTFTMAMKWNQMGKVMGKLMNQDIWINAPDDCGVQIKKDQEEKLPGSAIAKAGEEMIDDVEAIKEALLTAETISDASQILTKKAFSVLGYEQEGDASGP